MKTFAVLVSVFVGASGCAIQRAQVANDARSSMQGMSKEGILACMGPPTNKAVEGSTEVWSYNSGDGRTTTVGNFGSNTNFNASRFGNSINGNASTFGSASAITTSRYCVVNVVMNEGNVGRVNYLGPTGGLITAGEQCAFAVQACVAR